MTRDEAIGKWDAAAVRIPDCDGPETWTHIVDGLVAIGLLNLGGTNKPNEALRNALSIRGVDSDKVFGALAAAGLRVVRA